MPKPKPADPSVEWEEPPKRHANYYADTQGFVTALKSNPGKWAVYKRSQTHRAACQYLSKLGAEATSRTDENGRFTIYARWPVTE